MPTTQDIAKGAVAGLAAGLLASLAMNQFQALASKLQPDDDDGEQEDPATVKAADRVAKLAGQSLPDERKSAAGNAVHYAFGAALGAAYGIAAELRPSASTGWGSAFGLATFTLFDEVAVPAAGLGDWPTESSLGTQAYAGASHLVFGVVTEGARRAIRGLL